MEVLIVIGVIFLVLSFSSVLVLCGQWVKYREVYKTLPERSFYKNGDQVYSHTVWSYDDGFVWFTCDNDFRVSRDVYLHNGFITYLDPVSLYWMIKYRRWFKKNVDFNKIQPF